MSDSIVTHSRCSIITVTLVQTLRSCEWLLLNWKSGESSCREQITTLEFLVAYRLGSWAFTVIAQVQSLVRELRFHKPSSAEKTNTHITTTLARGRAALSFKRQLTLHYRPRPMHRKPPCKPPLKGISGWKQPWGPTSKQEFSFLGK